MKYAIAKKVSTQQCYNNEYEVVRTSKNHIVMDGHITVDVSDEIKKGDRINDSGKIWEM